MIFLDNCHETRYNHPMIKIFADKQTHDLFVTGKSKKFKPDILKRAIRRIEYIDLATSLEDLKVPPSNHLHVLKGNRQGQYALSIPNGEYALDFLTVMHTMLK